MKTRMEESSKGRGSGQCGVEERGREAHLWSPPAAMAVTLAGGLSLVGSSEAMAWGMGMAMGCGLGACT